MHKIIYTKRAKVELENLYNYIYFNLANPIAAKRFKANIIKPISNLEYFPYMGKKILNSKFRYLIFYSVNNQNVEIQRIIHKNQKVKYI
jgi:toxin ParE1/3/4